MAAVTYSYDGQSRLKLESKEVIRERVGFSPDRADALALTFAEPVVTRADSFVDLYARATTFARDDYSY
jgi:hypothetical protein